jgi:hypothetical protein
MILLEVEERDLPQRSTLMPSTDPDVLPPLNLCFYQGTDQPDKLPGKLENISANIIVQYREIKHV